jgi:hypothetical protein
MKRNDDTSNDPNDRLLYGSRCSQLRNRQVENGSQDLHDPLRPIYEALRPFTTSRMLFCDAWFVTMAAYTLADEAEQEYI